MPRLRHIDNTGTVRFVTFSCFQRYRLLTVEPIIEHFLRTLDEVRVRRGFKLLGYVVMPEHVHLVLWPPEGAALGRIIGEIKSRSARTILQQVRLHRPYRIDRLHLNVGGEPKTVFWQKRCYDHNCRSVETVREKIEYCHKNPVTRRLVMQPGEWRWSSFNWYAGDGDVPIRIDDWSL